MKQHRISRIVTCRTVELIYSLLQGENHLSQIHIDTTDVDEGWYFHALMDALHNPRNTGN